MCSCFCAVLYKQKRILKTFMPKPKYLHQILKKITSDSSSDWIFILIKGDI